MSQTPAGWYPDPYYPHLPTLRYWDGARWTSHTVASRVGSPQQAARPPARTPDGVEIAGWGERLLAYLLDALICVVLQFVVTVPILIAFFRSVFAEIDDILNQVDANPDGPVPAFRLTDEMQWQLVQYVALAVAVLVVYHVVFLRWKQATPGKLVMGLRVRLREFPGPLPWAAVFLRVIAQFWPAAFVLVPFLGTIVGIYVLVDGAWPLADENKQALHDKVAATNVVKVRTS